MRSPLLAKAIALIVIIVILLSGLGMIGDVISDRQRYSSEASDSITNSYAGRQTIMGPLIHSACTETWNETEGSDKDKRLVEKRREFLLLAMPDQLAIQSGAGMEQRERGLHKVNTYNLKGQIKAQWNSLEALLPQTTQKDSRINCGAPILMLSVGDTRGIRTAQLQMGESQLSLKPGTFHPQYTRGLHASLPDGLRGQTTPLAITLDFELAGTERIAFVPLGSTTEVQMSSNWPHPSFAGRFLPSEREVRNDGFAARWRLSALATTAQQDVDNGASLCDGTDSSYANNRGCMDSFSVSFIDPINPYSLADRAIKYGAMFVLLTFVAVGMFELMKRLRVHPVQYLLVGAALCTFFLLLVSLSEHFAFGIAYAVAASACVLLLTYYASFILGGMARGLPLGGGVALLYALLYLLLQLEQTALVVGAIALFAVLAAIMVATRKVNWYALTPVLPGAPAPAVQAPTAPQGSQP